MTTEELAAELSEVWQQMDRVNYWSAGERGKFKTVVGMAVRALTDIHTVVNDLDA